MSNDFENSQDYRKALEIGYYLRNMILETMKFNDIMNFCIWEGKNYMLKKFGIRGGMIYGN